jgi:hypothetical protein
MLKTNVKNHSRAQSRRPWAATMPATLSSMTTVTLAMMLTMSRTSKRWPAGVSVLKIMR